MGAEKSKARGEGFFEGWMVIGGGCLSMHIRRAAGGTGVGYCHERVVRDRRMSGDLSCRAEQIDDSVAHTFLLVLGTDDGFGTITTPHMQRLGGGGVSLTFSLRRTQSKSTRARSRSVLSL